MRFNSNTCGFDRFIVPDWPAPANVRALISTRGLTMEGNESVLDDYQAFNMGDHVGDAADVVEKNRSEFSVALGAKIQWLQQTHSTDIRVLTSSSQLESVAMADGAVTSEQGLACCVMTADCLPILLCTDDGSKVAAVHCGWRGLANGIIPQAIQKMENPGEKLMAYLGPAISQAAFEVGAEVKAAFEIAASNRGFTCPPSAFYASQNAGKFFADLYAVARAELLSLHISKIYGGGFCTFTQAQKFYSYRRAPKTGRIASAICII